MAGGKDNSASVMGLATQRSELVKQFTVLDPEGRPEFVYTAHYNAGDGDFATVTQYAYFNATTTLVEKMKEDNSTWSSAYDI
jgi:hypothetical protein